MPAVSHESLLCIKRAQASEQEWQPMQRSILGAVRIFIVTSPFGKPLSIMQIEHLINVCELVHVLTLKHPSKGGAFLPSPLVERGNEESL
jgi:hypothetical protein